MKDAQKLADAVTALNEGVDKLQKRMDAEPYLPESVGRMKMGFTVDVTSIFKNEKWATGESKVQSAYTTVYGVATAEEARAKAIKQLTQDGHSNIKIMRVRKVYG
jgi:hypothetical protein